MQRFSFEVFFEHETIKKNNQEKKMFSKRSLNYAPQKISTKKLQRKTEVEILCSTNFGQQQGQKLLLGQR